MKYLCVILFLCGLYGVGSVVDNSGKVRYVLSTANAFD